MHVLTCFVHYPPRFYRELRSALVDMEEFFGILRTKSHIKVGNAVKKKLGDLFGFSPCIVYPIQSGGHKSPFFLQKVGLLFGVSYSEAVQPAYVY